MRILVDLTGCAKGYSYWIYASRILQVWSKYDFSDIRIFLLITEDMEVLIKKEYPSFEYILFKRYPYRNELQKILRMSIFRDSLMWQHTVNRTGCDILFSPSSLVKNFWKIKMHRVQVIHDIQGSKTWSGLQRWAFCLFTPLILKHSDRIIAISNFVKQDILKTYSFVSPDKITVIHNGVTLPTTVFSGSLKSDYKYLLYVNSLCKYKNVGTLVKAFIELKDVIPHKLVIVGRRTDYWEEEIVPLIIKSSIKDRVVHLSHYVSDEEIVRLYQSADVFISPSLHEGFGYTPIEAAICGTPVICTKETALPEVTMGMLNYYEPALDFIALKNRIQEVLENYPTKEQLKKISDTFKAEYENVKQAKKIYDFLVKDIRQRDSKNATGLKKN